MSKEKFAYDDYYDPENISEYDEPDEAVDYLDDDFSEDKKKYEYENASDISDSYSSDNYDEDEDSNNSDGETEDLYYGEESYTNFKNGKTPKRKETKEKVSLKGEDVQKRFYKIMEDYHSGDPERKQYALECAIDELKGFIYSIIKKSYITYAKDNYYDLVQEGKIGIMEGMKKYDPSKSMPTTFFSPYIKHEMQLLITRQVDKTTAHYSTNIKKINKAIERFEIANTPYTNVDIAIQTGLSLETVNQSMAIRNYREEVHSDGCLPGVIDANLKSNHILTPEEDFMEKEEKEILYNAINDSLTPMEIKVLEMHFGINDSETFSEGEISKKLGIPKDKVKKLINSSIRKLKDSDLKNLYRDHLAHEKELIEETEFSFIPSLTIEDQLDIMSEDSFTDDEING